MTQLTQSFMKKPRNYLFLLLCLAVITTPAIAEIELTGSYYGFQFTNNKYKTGSDSEESWNFIDGKYGKQLNDWVSLEGRLGLSDNVDSSHGIINLGAYMRIGKDLGKYRPYGLLGGTYTYWYEEDLDELGELFGVDLDDSEDESGFSYGLGIEIFGRPNIALTFEVMRALDKSDDDGDVTIDQFALGFNYYFISDTSRFNKNRNKIRSIRYKTMVKPMRKSTLFLAFITSAAVMLLTGCSDDPVVDIDEYVSSAAPTGSVDNDNSLGDSTPTGRITADGFFILYDPAVPQVFDDTLAFTQQTVDITVFAEDVNDLVELNGQTVNFRAEWGSFLDARDSCDLVNGQCTVTWRSGSPFSAPGTCLVAITAYTTGEEAYVDVNDNNEFDVGETHFDLEEPYLNVQWLTTGNIQYDPLPVSTVEGVVELIDIENFNGTTPGVSNGIHDAGNGLYDGSQCAANNSGSCSGRESMLIHFKSFIQIQDPFDEPSGVDVNGNLIFDEENILYCGPNPY